MKKILLFMCALICSAAMSATDVYLVPNSNWLKDNARFAVYCFQGETNQWVDMEAVDGAEKYFKATVDETKFQNLIFCRMNPTITENAWVNKWNQSIDLTVPTDNKVVYHVKDATWDKGGGEWTALGEDPVDPIDPVDPTTKYYVTGNEELVGSANQWNVKAIELTYTDGIYTHTFSNVVAGKECQLKITDGTWNSTWGYSNLTVIPSGVNTNKNNNIIFTLSAAGDVTVQFDATEKKITLIGVSDTPAEDTYGIGSNLNSWTPTADPMTVADGVAKCTINLTSTEDFKFAVVKNGKWLKNVDGPITRENNTLALSEIDSWENCTLTPDKTGDYIFTFTIATNALVVTYPMDGPTSISSTEAEVVTTKVIRDGQVLIIRDGVVYNMMGQAIR